MVLGFKKNFPDGTPTHFQEKITLDETKLHSIRAGERWRPGMSIEMAYGARTKNYFQFNRYLPEMQVCLSVQSIEMEYNLITGNIDMRIDGVKVHSPVVNLVIKNDGLTKEQFVEWFFKDTNNFKGQIIQWTSLKYTPYMTVYQFEKDIQFQTTK